MESLQAFANAREAKLQAVQAVKDMMRITGHVHITCAELGTHNAIWVDYIGMNGNQFTRQYSWDKAYPDSTEAKMQWIYDALREYHLFKERIKMILQSE